MRIATDTINVQAEVVTIDECKATRVDNVQSSISEMVNFYPNDVQIISIQTGVQLARNSHKVLPRKPQMQNENLVITKKIVPLFSFSLSFPQVFQIFLVLFTFLRVFRQHYRESRTFQNGNQINRLVGTKSSSDFLVVTFLVQISKDENVGENWEVRFNVSTSF